MSDSKNRTNKEQNQDQDHPQKTNVKEKKVIAYFAILFFLWLFVDLL